MRIRRFPRFVLLLVLVIGVAAPGAAVADDHAAAGEHGDAAEAGHDEHHHHISFFVGSTQAEETHTGDREDPRFTLGVDYERRINQRIGIGGLLDWVAEGEREVLFGVPVFFHAGRRAKFLVAPSVQRARESDESKFVARFGFAYGFQVGRITLAPVANLDVTHEHEIVVLGLGVGWGL